MTARLRLRNLRKDWSKEDMMEERMFSLQRQNIKSKVKEKD